jgi:hypothetical protein
MSETIMSEYIKGFDHGCDYVVAEIERQIKEATSHEAGQAAAQAIRTMLEAETIEDRTEARYLVERGRQEARTA